LHANVYALEEKYEIAAMKEASLLKFAEKAESSWSSEDFRNAVKIVFTTTADQDRDLRDLVRGGHNQCTELIGSSTQCTDR
jgi:hypothetical protein